MASKKVWKLVGTFERQDGTKKADRTVVKMDFGNISDETMKQVMQLLTSDKRKVSGIVKAKSKTQDLRNVFG